MPDEALRNLEELLLRSRQGPALDGERQDKPVQASAESVGPDPHEHAHRMGAEPRTGKPGPVGGGFPFLDPLLLAHQVADPVGATTRRIKVFRGFSRSVTTARETSENRRTDRNDLLEWRWNGNDRTMKSSEVVTSNETVGIGNV
jgi:hypothetical protein